jgi:flagellar basal-body rod protein FlgB
MLANLTSTLDFQAKALVVRAERQRVIASNIANADTPGYAARDINFKESMNNALGAEGQSVTAAASSTGASDARHIAITPSTSDLGANALRYAPQSQPAMDGNSVDMDRERANFVDNAIRYEATLRFINAQAKIMLSAIQGQ